MTAYNVVIIRQWEPGASPDQSFTVSVYPCADYRSALIKLHKCYVETSNEYDSIHICEDTYAPNKNNYELEFNHRFWEYGDIQMAQIFNANITKHKKQTPKGRLKKLLATP